MRKLVASALCATVLSSSMYSASAESRVEFKTQIKNFAATITLQQKASGPNGSLAPGKTEVRLNIGKVLAQFESSIRFTDEDEDGNQRTDICRVSPKPMNGITGLPLAAGNGQLFNARLGIEVSDEPEFNREESNTFYHVSMNVPLNASGRDYLDLKYEEAIHVSDNSDGKWLTSKHITRAPGGGYVLAPMTFNIEKPGTLYVKTFVEFTQEISQPMCPNIDVSSWSPSHTVSIKETFEEIQISKLNQTIQNTKPSDLPLTNKISRLKFNASSGLPVAAVEVDSNICIVDKDLVYLLKPGKCAINLSQPGDDAYEAAPDLSVAFTILGSGRESRITCVKGKISKVVSGSKPVCPAGYKKK